MRLIEVLQEFDGRDRARLVALVDDGLSDPELGLVTQLCAENDARVGRGAMWIIRTLLEKKRGAALDLATVFKNLPTDYEWVTRFHLLQSVQYGAEHAVPYVDAIHALLDHERTAIRVAALDAFTHVAMHLPDRLPEARARLMQNVDDEKASIRARTRHMLKALAKFDKTTRGRIAHAPRARPEGQERLNRSSMS